ncbi:GGDEF domain-containing protein [Azospirillum thermophilum]|uniref:diguanylate cyclase n=1 Tax=Azospirillum thermophilum TaxID=2202148 RepID=A0A2S2CUE3_9PROT|nr:diguanylate cyclase [Azospirillum thermophilum]AWK88108.1 GGDEF domain-containing protein [Azospirillum thermophilum]
MTNILTALADGVGLLALIALGYGTIRQRLTGRALLRQVLIGVLFGAGGVIAMLRSVPIAPGVFLDVKVVPVALAAPFGGTLSTLLAAAIVAAGRTLVGGAGVLPAVTGIAIAGGMVLLVVRSLPDRQRLSLSGLLLLALAASVNTVGIFVLPWDQALPIFLHGGLPVSAFTVLGILLLGTMLAREARRLEAEAALRTAAMTDPLTGLANRRAFFEAAGRAAAAARRHGTPLSLLLLDVDHFKDINDGHGHGAGDLVLVTLARVLQEGVRQSDLVARFGGEEFTILLPNAPLAGAFQLAERLCDAVRDLRIPYGGAMIRLTVSVGVATLGPDGPTADDMVKAADTAMYRAKNGGRDQVCRSGGILSPCPG